MDDDHDDHDDHEPEAAFGGFPVVWVFVLNGLTMDKGGKQMSP